MKRKIRLICALLSLLLLAACGSAGTVERSGGAESAASVVDMSDVENNGGYYVRVGGKVYFRKYGVGALEKLATFGEFTDFWHVTGDESEIMSYDPATKKLETVFKDTGYGGLYVCDGWLYLQERVGDTDYVTRYGFDGEACETIGEGALLGLTDGGLLALERGDSFHFYRDGEEISSYEFGEPMMFAGLSEDGLFLLRVDYDNETDEDGNATRTFWQLPPDMGATPLCLGTLPDADFMYSAEPEQFVAAGDEIGAIVGYYAGTGHFLNESVAFTATPYVPDSLSVMESVPDMDGDEFTLPKLTVDDAGNIVAAPYLYGDLRIGWEEGQDGDLQLYDGSGWTTLQKNFCPYREEGGGYAKILQNMEYLDGAAYVTLAAAYASILNDIGWRDAYSLLDMRYVVVPASGEARELAYVEYDTVLQGNVWFQDGAESVLWQETTLDPDAWNPEADFAFLIPVSPDAVWENEDEILWNAVLATPEGEPEYYGYPVPDTAGQFLCLRLNRDGEVVFLTEKSPDALLSIDVGVTKAELSDAVRTIELTRRPSDEDTLWHWTRLTALENGVTVLIERTPEQETETEETTMQEGLFVPGSTLFRGVLNRGESVGLYASLPWHPEIRVAVMRNGTYGDYIFGEDNYLHEEPVDGRYAQKILAGYPLEEDGVTGQWLYRDALTQKHTVRLNFEADNTLAVVREDTPVFLTWSMGYLYAEEWETPDLLCLEAVEPDTVAAINMEGGAGDYFVERFEIDGETILHLTQVNNGDAALDILISSQEQWLTEFVLHRYTGAAAPAAPLRNVSLTATVVKVDAERNAVWLQEAEARYDDELTQPRFRAKPYANCVCCPLASAELLSVFSPCNDPEYPMKAYQITIDRDGFVTSLTTP